MDFTREPIIETIITPKEGYKLVIRSSKSTGQEEYFVDAVEVVAFGHALFFRSLERPKAFVVPVSDYEVLEVREARMVLKNAGLDRSIKIGGGKETNFKASREEEKVENVAEVVADQAEVQQASGGQDETRPDVRVDKKRDRRRNYRKRRGREDDAKDVAEPVNPPLEGEQVSIPSSELKDEIVLEAVSPPPVNLSSLLQPPPTLISETINRYRQNDLFKGAFYLTEEDQYKPHDKVQELLNDEDETLPKLQEPDFDSPESLKEANSFVESKESDELGEGVDLAEELSRSPYERKMFQVEESEELGMSLPIYAQEEDVSMEKKSPYTHLHEEEGTSDKI